MTAAHSDKKVQETLADYVRNDMTTKEIADRRGISPSTVTVWAQNAGLNLRPRGRRKLDAPNERQRAILEMCEYATDEVVAQHFGTYKQAIQRLRKRWDGWEKPKKAPFTPGDVIQWQGERLTVMAATPQTGTLINKKGRKLFQFRWNQNGRLPKKVGVDPHYAVRPEMPVAA